jgi:hypothetical protein
VSGRLDDGARILKVVLVCRCGEVYKEFHSNCSLNDIHCPCGQVHRIDWPAVEAGISFAQAPVTPSVTPPASQVSGPGAGGKL